MYQAGCRAKRRGLTPVPRVSSSGSSSSVPPFPSPKTPSVLPSSAGLPPGPEVTVGEVLEPGPVEKGVCTALARLSAAATHEDLVAQARTLARDLDDHRLATSHASVNRQLSATMAELRRNSEPRKGRLARIQAMSGWTEPDAMSQPSRGKPSRQDGA